MEHATEDGIKQARSYSTTPTSCKEIKPRNANEVLHSIFVFEFGIPRQQKIAVGLFLAFIICLSCLLLFFVGTFVVPLGLKIPWVMSHWMRMEYSLDCCMSK